MNPRPMQYLDVVGRLYPDIISGRKTNTIRWQEPRIVPGQLTFVNCDDRLLSVTVNVVRCSDMPLSKVAGFLHMLNVWPDAELLEGMRRHYPTITLDEIVQVVEFTASDQH